jgi:hypothetical protein
MLMLLQTKMKKTTMKNNNHTNIEDHLLVFHNSSHFFSFSHCMENLAIISL